MKYALRDGSGKTINIPDAFIDNAMRTLELDRQGAVELYLSDEGIEVAAEVVELTAKAKTAGAGAKATGEKVTRKAPERKPDILKREIVAALAAFIAEQDEASEVEVTNIERMIAFAVGDEKFEVTLTKKRAPKK